MKKRVSWSLALLLAGTMGMLTACKAGTPTGDHTANDPSGQTTAATISTTMPPASTDAPTTASSSDMEPPGTLPPTTTGTIWDPDVEESYSDDDSDREYYDPFTFQFGILPSQVGEIVGYDVVDAWSGRHIKEKYGDDFESITWRTYDYYEQTAVLCLRELHISKERFTEWAKEKNEEHSPVMSLTQAEIDALYSGDAALINRTFKNSYALYDSGKLYAPYWLASKTASDYQAAGLSLERLEKQVQFFKDGEVLEDGRVVRWVYGKRLAAIEKNVAAYRQLLGK